MMQLNSARSAWHDALYTPWDRQGAHFEQIGRLGCSVQKTAKSINSRHAMHQSISARIQQAIATLPGYLQAFGNHLYSPLSDIDEQEEAQERVLHIAYAAGPKMTARKLEKARYVAQVVLLRYKRLNQGGQGEGIDPLPTVEKMREYILETSGVRLVGDQWARDWGSFVDRCFDACSQLDKAALAPVAKTIAAMKEVA